MKQPSVPAFRTDAEAEDFVDTADLSAFDLTGGSMLRYEFSAKTANISMRVPQKLLDDVKAEAARIGIPYQRFIRQTLEAALGAKRR